MVTAQQPSSRRTECEMSRARQVAGTSWLPVRVLGHRTADARPLECSTNCQSFAVPSPIERGQRFSAPSRPRSGTRHEPRRTLSAPVPEVLVVVGDTRHGTARHGTGAARNQGCRGRLRYAGLASHRRDGFVKNHVFHQCTTYYLYWITGSFLNHTPRIRH
jgi:hypothetical protein